MKIAANGIKILMIMALVLISFADLSIAEDTNSKIAFLQFRIDSDSITLTNSTLTEGKLKNSRDNSIGKEIYYEVISVDSRMVYSGNMDNPLVKKLEYENPDKSGEILNKIINLESTEFTIRINYDDSINKINFYQTRYNQDLKSIKNTDNLIGSVSLTSVVGGENE